MRADRPRRRSFPPRSGVRLPVEIPHAPWPSDARLTGASSTARAMSSTALHLLPAKFSQNRDFLWSTRKSDSLASFKPQPNERICFVNPFHCHRIRNHRQPLDRKRIRPGGQGDRRKADLRRSAISGVRRRQTKDPSSPRTGWKSKPSSRSPSAPSRSPRPATNSP